MSLVHLKNKENGITYLYESTGYWDKESSWPGTTFILQAKLYTCCPLAKNIGNRTCKGRSFYACWYTDWSNCIRVGYYSNESAISPHYGELNEHSQQ